MKLFLVLALAALFGARTAGAQGFLVAANQNSAPLSVYLYGETSTHVVGAPGSPLGPGSVIVTLWIATNGAPSSQLTQIAVGTNSTSTSPLAYGTFNLGNPLVLPAPWDGSSQIELVYRAWAITSGAATWQQVILNASIPQGESALLTGFSLGTGIEVPPMTFAAGGALSGITTSPMGGILLHTIPEPSSSALVALGSAALVAIHRRKARN